MNPLMASALVACSVLSAVCQELPSREAAAEAMRKGAQFFREQVAVEGSYLWQYSPDLTMREGEGKASPTQGWVQPPGTPAVGMALLQAWEAAGDDYYLDAAREAAVALLHGQLRSGGWHYAIEFDPKRRRKTAYRISGGGAKARNVTTFDDDVTQSALRFLMRMDEALQFQDERIHEAVEYALQKLRQAQYPNGAWPQGYAQFPEPDKFPVQRAAYPESWPRTWPGSGEYWLRYTLNDNALATIIETLIECERIYSSTNAPKTHLNLAHLARDAAQKAGDFLLRAQMPAPQPAWAQQYDFEMHPAWARKFEPPAITAGESQRVLRTLMVLYRATGQTRYLEPIPRALAYLKTCRLPEGGFARFYELRSNKPLYFTRKYELTYEDGNVPTHYSFKVEDNTDAIAREFELLKSPSKNESRKQDHEDPEELAREVRRIIAAQDPRGAWLEPGKLRAYGDDSPAEVIRTATFNENLDTLSRYLRLTAKKSAD